MDTEEQNYLVIGVNELLKLNMRPFRKMSFKSKLAKHSESSYACQSACHLFFVK